jgi:ABC-type uncharacterized transport system ATPase subunit
MNTEENNMAKKQYEVIAEKYVGKHRTYQKGSVIPETEVFGDLEIALKGQKGVKRDEKPLKDFPPTLREVSESAAKKKKVDDK